MYNLRTCLDPFATYVCVKFAYNDSAAIKRGTEKLDRYTHGQEAATQWHGEEGAIRKQAVCIPTAVE